jgi:hypothetical protein
MPTVLIAETDHQMRVHCRRLMNTNPFRVETAGDGLDCWSA